MNDLAGRLIYQDPWLAAFDKPAGLLCQPGLILMATNASMHRQLSALFAQRQIRKARTGTRPPRYGSVVGGKIAINRWRLLTLDVDRTGRPLSRVLPAPRTGRSHQLRVQMAEWTIRCWATPSTEMAIRRLG
ncbi:hypothetical protein [Cyanobium sp. WAJ14-Wanaka]|uniref:hypothetical protein n=1 Tax=Cyanobium sp. WAJ14-Wanaka TaxID=2823725 RepID=UPI0020CC3B59|nr:hypothetical protein [Cyanobium sp. WAJ14-Wanaka]